MAAYKPHALLGWREYAQGLPYPKAYDGWKEIDQRNYENGRMRAANYRLAIGDRPLPPTHPSSATYQAIIAGSGVGHAFLSVNHPERSIPGIMASRQRVRA